MTTKIIVADDHPLFRAALTGALAFLDDAEIIEAASMGEVQTRLAEHNDADLVLLDLNMPGANGFSGLAFLRGQMPELPVVVVSGAEDGSTINKCMDLGASGFIPKSAPLSVLSTAIGQVLDGGEYLPEGVDLNAESFSDEEARLAAAISSLTPQQFRVMSMLTQGLLNKQIAYDLDVSEATIKAHVTAILRKLGVNSRTQAVIVCQRLDLAEFETPS
ncbi:response regulator [Litorivicinus lipolyticus]|uniref:Response regulator n=1 Tax=Litorivicinus lipolyticus TaxID=418701 RepID=A0A5Q2Q7A1_9GAMM|nr:response regulator transcription factor [Litorivicinus lipolyticus]QGG79798.1 response regulator [Litorivicinus lipolyticus]